jgi:hypothetical protein
MPNARIALIAAVVVDLAMACGNALAQNAASSDPSTTQPSRDFTADPALATAMSGSYTLASDRNGRQCQFQLGAERSGEGYKLFLPAGCRTAFPILRAATNWSLDAQGSLVVLGPKGNALGTFAQTSQTAMTMDDPSSGGQLQITGETPGWLLRRNQVMTPETLAPSVQEAAPAEPALANAEPEKPAAPPPPPEDKNPAAWEGWYQIVRAGGKETACKLAFLSTEAVTASAKAAALDEKCADKGMLIFKPIAWRKEGDQLILTAGRGHELTMSKSGEFWTKAVPSGEELLLKKID